MIPVSDYTIVSHDRISVVVERVQKLIADGWVPLGGIVITVPPDMNYGSVMEYHQTMVKPA